MFKVIVTLTAAATSAIGQLCTDETKATVQTEPIKKEIVIKKEIIIKKNQSTS